MKQFNLFQDEPTGEKDSKYTSKIKAPIYEPKNRPPHVFELVDTYKTKRLINEIQNADITDQEKQFLIEAAHRHSVFNYEKIADYYAHATPQMQHLMERSALVIIDFEDAIQYGYVQLCSEIQSQYLEEYGE